MYCAWLRGHHPVWILKASPCLCHRPPRGPGGKTGCWGAASFPSMVPPTQPQRPPHGCLLAPPRHLCPLFPVDPAPRDGLIKGQRVTVQVSAFTTGTALDPKLCKITFYYILVYSWLYTHRQLHEGGTVLCPEGPGPAEGLYEVQTLFPSLALRECLTS